ncbi:MAG: response regulator [Proteobacteria bacterium]|nr:response regulator [Pseudomonadota bacterium]
MQQQAAGLNRNALIGVTLGALASLASAIPLTFLPWAAPAFASFFLFLAAGSLGFVGSAASILTAVGYVTFLGLDPIQLARLAALAIGWSWVRAHKPHLAGFTFVAVSWIAGILPALWIAQSLKLAFVPWQTIGLWMASDFFSSLLVGLVLLNPELWFFLTKKPLLHVPRTALLVHSLVFISLVATIGIFWSVPALALLMDGHLLLSLVVVAVGFPIGTGLLLSKKILDAEQNSRPSLLLKTPRQHSFSGLSSYHLRTRNSAETGISSRGRSIDTETRLMLSAPGASRTAVENAICAIDNLGTVAFVNRRFLKLFEVKDAVITGRKIDTVAMNPAARDAIVRHLQTTSQVGPHSSEVRLNELPENLRFVELTSAYAEDLGDSALGSSKGDIIISARDITDRRAIETQLLQAQRLASLGNFISGIGHTFNNALMLIVGKSAVARRAPTPETREAALQDIIDAAWGAAAQVTKLVKFAEGPPTLAKTHDICAVVHDHITLLQGMLSSRYPLSVKTGERLGMNCDSNLILQAITNLALNARDSYEEAGGAIDIEVSSEEIREEVSAIHTGARPGNFIRIRVRDQGVGMTADVLAHAFDPLFTTRKQTGHSGLGLSTVYAIVRAHDGFLTVESHPNKGTTASLYFPRVALEQHETQADTPTQSHQAPEPAAGARILVVDDEPSIQDLVVTMLGSLGYTASSCGTGAEALDRCNAGKFDLVLVDYSMPQLPGTELIAKLRAMNYTARTVLMTGYGHQMAGSSESARLAKPFDIETLSQTIIAALSESTTTIGDQSQ